MCTRVCVCVVLLALTPLGLACTIYTLSRYKGRATGGIASHKAPFAHPLEGAEAGAVKTLIGAVKHIHPTGPKLQTCRWCHWLPLVVNPLAML